MDIKQKNIKEVIKEGWKVDKVKFKYILKRINQIQKILDNLATDNRVTKFWESKDFKQCNKNFTIETNKATLYLGIGSNQLKGSFEDHQKTLIIEFNPQKINPFEEIDYLRTLKEIELHRRDIMYIDMAYDMYIPIESIKYQKRRINEYECKISHEKLETVYLRKMGVNGTVRIYDKTLEMNGGTDEDIEEDTGEVKQLKYIGDCTRYEIRIKPGEYSKKFNLVDPFLLEQLVKLHNLEIKQENQEEKILKEIYRYTGNDFTNLITVHIGATDKLNNRAKKKYKELYEDIKKSIPSDQLEIQKIKNFNLNSLLKTFKTYIKDTTIHPTNAILEGELT